MKEFYAFSLENLFKQYYPRLCHFAWQLLGDKELSEDVVQDAFMAYWKNREAILENEVAIKNFLYSSVRNSCLNAFRRSKVMERYHQLHQEEAFEESQVMAKIIRTEVMDEILNVMQTLPEGCKEVFRLGYLEGLSNPQIAKQLEISVNTVKTQKQRGLNVLRAKLNPEFFALIAAIYMV